jgi:hypothetical protein
MRAAVLSDLSVEKVAVNSIIINGVFEDPSGLYLVLKKNLRNILKNGGEINVNFGLTL